MREQIEKSLSKIRPNLQADGGDVELIDVDEVEKIVTVRLVGACAGCPMSTMTLQHGIEKQLKTDVPELKRVEAVM